MTRLLCLLTVLSSVLFPLAGSSGGHCLHSPLGAKPLVVTCPFGAATGRGRDAPRHRGVDFRAAAGASVTACDYGRVTFAGLTPTGVGRVEVLIGDGRVCAYAHLRRWSVSVGDVVHRGAVVGESGGARGAFGAGPKSTGPHLHFEVIRQGHHVNPLPQLCRRAFRR